jgi:hypothetical protein
MGSSPALQAARKFLSVVWNGPAPTDAALAAALDRLVAVYHDTPDADSSDTELDPPEQDGTALYKEVAARFPDYGLYPISDPTASVEDAAMLGDAIDDLADLTLDMREVVCLRTSALMTPTGPSASTSSTGGGTRGNWASICTHDNGNVASGGKQTFSTCHHERR